MFLRLIFIVVIAWVVWKLWKRAGQRMAAQRSIADRPAEMVSCAVCGTFVLQHEAIHSGDRWYCSENCRKNG